MKKLIVLLSIVCFASAFAESFNAESFDQGQEIINNLLDTGVENGGGKFTPASAPAVCYAAANCPWGGRVFCRTWGQGCTWFSGVNAWGRPFVRCTGFNQFNQWVNLQFTCN